MNKLIFILFSIFLVSKLNAYFIGGEYAMLIDCRYGNYGYQYGNIGTYKTTRGDIYQIFFGNNWCQY